MSGQQQSCDNFSKQSRDDESQAGQTLFYVCFSLFTLCLLVTLVAMVLKLRSNTKQKHKLSLVYFFAILTLLGK